MYIEYKEISIKRLCQLVTSCMRHSLQKNLLMKSIICRFYIFMHCKLEGICFDFFYPDHRDKEWTICMFKIWSKSYSQMYQDYISWNGQYCEKNIFEIITQASFYWTITVKSHQDHNNPDKNIDIMHVIEKQNYIILNCIQK